MEPEKLHVKISGPLLGKILHEKHKKAYSCGGLLFGETLSQTQNKITDAQHVVESRAFMCIQDFHPKSSAEIMESFSTPEAWGVKPSLSNSSCVGVFKVRKFSMQMTLLEKSMHRKLLRKLKSKAASQSYDFVVTVIISHHENETKTCLSWKIAAYVLHQGRFIPIQIEISNLQGSVSGSYSTQPSPVRSLQSANANRIMQTFKTSVADNSGNIKIVQVTREATEDLINELSDALTKLQNNEKVLERALIEKDALLLKLEELHVRKKSCASAPSASVPMATNDEKMFKNSGNSGGSNPFQRSNANNQNESRDSFQMPTKVNKLDSQWRRSSMDDIQRRSPVVVLEKLDSENSSPVRNPMLKATKDAINSEKDHFANLVLNAKKKLTASPNNDNASHAKTDIQTENTAWSSRTRSGQKSHEKPS